MGAPGLGYITFEEGVSFELAQGQLLPSTAKGVVVSGGDLSGGLGKGPIAKFVPVSVQKEIAAKTALKPGDAVFFAAGKEADANRLAGAARTKIGDELGLGDKNKFEFCWIVDFPMYEWNEEEKKIDFSHNPFSMPNMKAEEFLALDTRDRDKILSLKAIQYDIVCNGVELSSGAIRNHRPDVMKKAFAIAGYGEDVLDQKFGGMLRALTYGAPPHGGIAPGIDRIVMLLCGEENLREVVLFPMNQRAEDLLMGAPSEVTPKQLRELHIRVVQSDK
jgi:aspartyl-tRNA synthetase